MDVVRALLYLRLTSLANLLRGNLRRLRQPKYLAGALAAGAYFWFFFLRKGPGSGGAALARMFADGRIEWVAAAALTLFLLLAWVLPGEKPGLNFNEPEVAFLFPAPLTRAQLIHYKLVDGLVRALFGALFFSFLSASVREPGAFLRHVGAWWALNTTLSLHTTAAALSITRLSAVGLGPALRRALLLTGATVVLGGGVWLALTRPGALDPLLAPTRLLIRPFLAADAADYLPALGPALGLMVLHYLWIHRLETPFEEASIDRARKLGETVSRMRAGRIHTFDGRTRRAPFRLGDHLPPEAALLWKNLMAAPGWLNRWTWLAFAGAIIAGLLFLKAQDAIAGPKLAGIAGIMFLVLLVYLLVFGPQLARNDLRGDLLHADMLKAWPLPGWRLVFGGLLAPTVHLTAIAWLLLLGAAIGLGPTSARLAWLTPGLRVAGAAALALVLPGLCAVQLLVPNAGALLFPAWVRPPGSHAGGIDVMGQRLLFFIGQFIVLLLTLLPAVALGGLTIFLTQWLLGLPTAIALAALPVLVVLAGEVWLGVRLLGPRFDHLDISDEPRP